MILEQDKKKLSVDVIFTREALNPQTLKTVSAFFLQTVTFEIWKESEFENLTLTSMLGHGVERERIIKVFLKKTFPDRTLTQEIDFHSPINGLTISASTEKRLTRARVLELIRSGKVRTFDNENRILSKLPS